MTPTEIHEALFENTIRFETVIYLAGALSQADSLPDDLRELLDEEDDATVAHAFHGFPLSLRDEGDCYLEFAAEWLIDNQRLGLLVKVATPVMKFDKKTESSMFSWGHYRTYWVYAETMDEVVSKAISWANERRAAEKVKAK